MHEKTFLARTGLWTSFRHQSGRKLQDTAWQKLSHNALLCLVACFAGGLSITASAEEFTIENAKTKLVDQIYVLNANLKHSFSSEALDALENGVSLNLVLDIEVIKPRRYMWDDVIATLEQRYELQYLALADQYLLANKNSGAQHVFHTLDEALKTLKKIDGLPLIDAHLLNKDERYKVQVRSRLDIDSLPVPLRLTAYFSTSWYLNSGWYSWDL